MSEFLSKSAISQAARDAKRAAKKAQYRQRAKQAIEDAVVAKIVARLRELADAPPNCLLGDIWRAADIIEHEWRQRVPCPKCRQAKPENERMANESGICTACFDAYTAKNPSVEFE